MSPPEELLTLLKQEHSFTIASHINPEGDAIGSSVALAIALKRMGKDVGVYIKDGVPEMYHFMPAVEIIEDSLSLESLKDRIFILVDCNEPKRTGIEETFQYRLSVVIDHHETKKDFGDIRWVEPEAPATGLMIYYLLKALGVEITPDIATNLYVAIAVDTGTFRYDNTSAEVLRVAAELIERGVSPGWVARNLYESWSTRRFNLLRQMLNTMELHNSGPVKVAITVITEEMFRQTGTDASDTDDFSNVARMLRDVDVSVLLRQDGPSKWKASMRSKGEFNVAKVAKVFGGGGHRNAAGFIVEGSLEEIKGQLLKRLQELGSN